jgi:hypothetical protein
MDIVKRLGKVCLLPIVAPLLIVPTIIFAVGSPIEYITCGDIEYSLYPLEAYDLYIFPKF